MQGQTTDLATNETDTSPDGHGRMGTGNGANGTGSVDELVLGGAARDELDDLLHLLEIDTTTRNCEPLLCSLIAMLQLLTLGVPSIVLRSLISTACSQSHVRCASTLRPSSWLLA